LTACTHWCLWECIQRTCSKVCLASQYKVIEFMRYYYYYY